MDALLRELAPQVLGAIVRRYRDFAASEDAVQEAMIAAAAQWPREGVPDNPRGWLIRVAAWRMTDHVRAESARQRREHLVVSLVPAEMQTIDVDAEADDTLVLLFTCCHPSLSTASAIALTLRAVGGLTTAEIARAFLVPEATMAQRISRAKQTIATSGVPLEVPDAGERAQRLVAVLHVLYLIFNEGYTDQRTDLAAEALRLTRIVHGLRPDDREIAGLLALMLLTDARRDARMRDGELVPLDEQDRSLWNAAQIAEGLALVAATLPRGEIGAYQIQAAIAACHDEAARAEDTDWSQILALYEVLARLQDNPMVELNRAIATAMVHGPAAGLAMLAPLDQRLAHNHRLDAVRGHLHERAGDRDAAIACFRRAAERTTSILERNYLAMKAARLATG